jgi:hypothetical protein
MAMPLESRQQAMDEYKESQGLYDHSGDLNPQNDSSYS